MTLDELRMYQQIGMFHEAPDLAEGALALLDHPLSQSVYLRLL
jgi:hypothetical protein